MSLERNLTQIRNRMDAASRKAGRDPADVALVAVTKSHPLETILPLAGLGQTIVGENRVQELAEKFEGLKGRFQIHFIGHLQTNKAKQAAHMAGFIHSVDSERLAVELNKAAEKESKTLDILIQANTSFEPQKSGLAPEALLPTLKALSGLAHLKIRGLMTMAMLTDDESKVRASFRLLRDLRDRAALLALPGVEMRHLSMGMSHDFEIAIEEGATLVRVGSALYEGLAP